jgi:hypothetical protein
MISVWGSALEYPVWRYVSSTEWNDVYVCTGCGREASCNAEDSEPKPCSCHLKPVSVGAAIAARSKP